LRGVLAELRRQVEHRRVRSERRGQIHHLDGTGKKRFRDIVENVG
jgi:hypothetical protein